MKMSFNISPGFFPQKVLLTFLYSLAFILSVQVQKPVWQDILRQDQAFIGTRSINLLPVQEHSSKQTNLPVHALPFILFRSTCAFSKLFLRMPAMNFLTCSGDPERSSSLGSVNILLPILRI